jgi:hypothetical protein
VSGCGAYAAKKLSESNWLSESLLARRQPSGADPGTGDSVKNGKPVPAVQTLTVFLLMAILTQALFALVSGNLMAFTFLSARHNPMNVLSYQFQVWGISSV